jgi:hypothetical protein
MFNKIHLHTDIDGGIFDGISQFHKVDTVMPLSDTAIKNAKPKDKPYKLTDEKGMFLLVNQNGSKYFRLDY